MIANSESTYPYIEQSGLGHRTLVYKNFDGSITRQPITATEQYIIELLGKIKNKLNERD